MSRLIIKARFKKNCHPYLLNYADTSGCIYFHRYTSTNVICNLNLGVYSETGELLETAFIDVSIANKDDKVDELVLNFRDTDGYDVRRYNSGVPILTDSKLIRKSDGSLEVSGNKVIFLPVIDTYSAIQGFWVFRLKDLTFKAYLSVEDLGNWFDALAKDPKRYENVVANVEEGILEVSCFDSIVHVSDIPALAEHLMLCSYSGLQFSHTALQFENEPTPCSSFYLPDLLCNFELSLSPAVGSESVFLGKTLHNGFLSIDSNGTQPRSIFLQGTNAHVELMHGNLTVDVKDTKSLYLEIVRANNLNLQARGNFARLVFDGITNLNANVVGDVGKLYLYRLTSAPTIVGDVNQVFFKGDILESLPNVNNSSFMSIEDTVIRRTISSYSGGSVTVFQSDVHFEDLCAVEFCQQVKGSLALGKRSTLESIMLSDIVISSQHIITGLGKLQVSDVRFEPNGVLVLKDLKDTTQGHCSLALGSVTVDDIDSKVFIRNGEVIDNPLNVVVDLQNVKPLSGIIELDLIFSTSSNNSIVRRIFRNIISGIKVLVSDNVTLKVNILLADGSIRTQEEYKTLFINYLMELIHSTSREQSSQDMDNQLMGISLGILELRDNTLSLTEKGISLALKSARRPFRLFKRNNPNAKIAFGSLSMD